MRVCDVRPAEPCVEEVEEGVGGDVAEAEGLGQEALGLKVKVVQVLVGL